jgi:hypothetical protein
MAVARVAYWRSKLGKRKQGKRMQDEREDLFSFAGFVGTIWLDSVEDPDASLNFAIFESWAGMEGNGKDSRFRRGLEPFAAVLERLPPELHVDEVDLVRLKAGFGETA